MKKFTKGCLITALVLFIFGCAFYGVCGFMGGFRQLRERNIMRGNGMFSIGIPVGIPGLEWGFDGHWFSFGNNDWDDWGFGITNLADTGEKEQTAYTASDITDIDIELGGCNLIIEESTDDCIWIENRSNVKTVKYGVKNGTFKLYNGKTYGFNSISNIHGSVYLYLPEGMDLSSIDIEMGAGNLESIALTAHSIELEVGAGNFEIEGLSGNEVNISVGAGGVVVENADVKELDMETAAGSIELTGTVSGDADIECAAGSISLFLYDDETDFDYEIECAVGSININGDEYSGLATERSISNKAGKEMNIDTAAGSVEVNFIK